MTPDGWRSAKLGAIAQVNPEQLAHRTDPDYLLEYLDISAVERPGIIGASRTLTFSEAPSRARRRARAGDILVSTVRPYLRNFVRIGGAPSNLVASTGYAVVRPADGVDGRFLYQHVLSDAFVEFLKPRMSGSNYPAVKSNDVRAYTFAVPSLPEQRKIAAILSSVDEAIEKTQAVIDQVQVVKRGLMQELLTRGLPGRHTRFKQTEIGEIPEEWDLITLEDFCAQVTDGTHDTPKRANQGFPLLTSKNLRNGMLDFESCYLISEEDCAEISKRSRVDAGDVLFGMIGTIGNPVIVPREAQEFAIKNVALFKLDGDLTKAGWLVAYLESPMFARRVQQQQTGNAQKFLSLGFLRRFRILNPPVDERGEIVGALRRFDQRLRIEAECFASLKRLKTAFMSVLLTGELRVTPNTEVA